MATGGVTALKAPATAITEAPGILRQPERSPLIRATGRFDRRSGPSKALLPPSSEAQPILELTSQD